MSGRNCARNNDSLLAERYDLIAYTETLVKGKYSIYSLWFSHSPTAAV